MAGVGAPGTLPGLHRTFQEFAGFSQIGNLIVSRPWGVKESQIANYIRHKIVLLLCPYITPFKMSSIVITFYIKEGMEI